MHIGTKLLRHIQLDKVLGVWYIVEQQVVLAMPAVQRMQVDEYWHCGTVKHFICQLIIEG